MAGLVGGMRADLAQLAAARAWPRDGERGVAGAGEGVWRADLAHPELNNVL